MLRVEINGTSHQLEEGLSILQALRKLQIQVPTLCHDERLKPYGGCRLCMVEIAGYPKLQPACTTPLAEGMQIQTHSERAEKSRYENLKLLAEQYPATESLDERVEFQRYLLKYGLTPTGGRNGEFLDNAHPYLKVDMSKCVYCYRCVRICNEVQGQFVWRVWNRGDRTEIRPDGNAGMLESSCVSCGACADTCPSGAIMDRLVAEKGAPERWVRTTCPYCGTGCEMNVGVRGTEVVVAKPVLEAPVNKGHLCVKGRYAHRFAHSQDRATSPMIREGDGWRRVSWDEALEHIATRLNGILEETGPSSVGVLGSARATNEENYLAQKFARVVLKSNNVDCCARVCHAPSAAALKATLGTGAATNSFDDIEIAKAFLVCGANPTENHPIVGARIKQQVLRGAKLVVIDPRQIELTAIADVHLQNRPGTNIPVLHAIAHSIIEQKLVDCSFIEERTAEFEAFRQFLAEWTPRRAAEMAGIKEEDIAAAARIYASNAPAMIFHGLGMTEHSQGTESVRCLVNLALLTGNVGKPGTGENPLRGQNNVQGSAHMGCEPSNLAGYTPIAQSAELVESVWGAPVPREQGLNWMQMLDSAKEGKLRALWAIGYDVYFSGPNSNNTGKSLEGIELLIIQDLFLNETAKRYAHVFLPACSSYEKDGTFMNSERRVQRVRQCIPLVGESKSDWEIVCLLAQKMGFGKQFAFENPEQIWEEVRKVWKPGAGISYARIEHAGLQWPCPSEDHPGTQRLHAKTFPMGDRASFSSIPFRPTPEELNEEFPFLLVTGRSLYQFNAGTMTLRTGNTMLRETDYLDMNPSDAQRLQLENGDPVKMTSRYGEAILPARIDPGIQEGQLFTTFHDPRVFLNRVTSGYRDSVVGTPEYKVTAVRLERAEALER